MSQTSSFSTSAAGKRDGTSQRAEGRRGLTCEMQFESAVPELIPLEDLSNARGSFLGLDS
jgi:hypothetical protein